MFDELRAQGLCACGSMQALYELDELPKTRQQKKHSDAVVDCFKVRGDLQQRLAEFEIVLKACTGTDCANEGETGEEIIFSARFGSPVRPPISELSPSCSRSTTQLAPARTCDGSSVKQFFDIKRLVNGDDRRRRYPWLGSTQRYYFPDAHPRRACHVALAWNRPVRRTQPNIRNASRLAAAQNVDFKYPNDRGDIVAHNLRSKASCPIWSYRETESTSVRWAVPSQPGLPRLPQTRLRREARYGWW
jgi:excinuclease ABC subunit A